MDLILWRHAQAQALSTDMNQDMARELTRKGTHQADQMAKWLNKRLPSTVRVLASPAKRTQQTAKALGRPFHTVQEINPQASVDDLWAAACWPTLKDTVVIVGHQPTLGLLAARLLTGQDLAWSVRKGAVWWLRLTDREGGQQVALHAVQSPDLL